MARIVSALNNLLIHAVLTGPVNAVFNSDMSNTDLSDAALIAKLGGPSEVAKRLNYPTNGGPQRVHNWTKRGIPAKVKLEHPELFLAHEALAAAAAAAINTPEATQG